MSTIDQIVRQASVGPRRPMKPRPLKPSRKQRGWFFLLLVLALTGVLLWPAIHRAHVVRQDLPARPDFGTSVPALIDEIAQAETTARGWRSGNPDLERLAGLYHANGFFNEALSCYQLLARLDPGEPRWPHLIAAIEASFGRLDDAVPFEEQAVRLAPGNFIVRLRLGDFLFKRNEVKDAENAYRRALQIAPDNPYVLLGLSRCALRQEDWTTARTHLRRAVEAKPDFAAAWALLTDVEIHLGDNPAATYARSRGNKQFRELPDPWLGFLDDLCYDPYQLSVTAAALTTEPARAQRLLERAIALAPQSSAYHRELAKLLITTHENAGARTHLEKAVTLTPDDAESWSAYITLLLDLREGRTAVTALQEALSHCPQSGYLHFIKGQALAATGHPNFAEAEFKISQRLQPAELRAYLELVSLYVKAGRLQEAVDEAHGAFVADPGSTTIMGMLAQLYIMQGNESEALQWTRKIRAIPGDQSAVLQQIQLIYGRQFSRSLPD
jgi:tetratricopeptide (TPR) repeat protein